jgi:hypothetical protein
MKTAVSVPDPVFHAGEKLAHRLGISRSRLYSQALQEFVQKHDDEEITRRLNEVYKSESSEIDPVVARIAARALPKESWR